MPRLDVLKNRGFTLIETLVVVLILGISFAIATPSFLSSMEKFRLEQAVVEVRSAFREAQKYAIRKGEACFVVMDLDNNQLTAPCININERSLPDRVKLATNIRLMAQATETNSSLPQTESYLVASTELTNLMLANTPISVNGFKIVPCFATSLIKKSFCIRHDSGEGGNGGNGLLPRLSAVNFGILGTAEFTITKPNLSPETAIDQTAKVVFYTSEAANATKKCIAISNTLGLTRAGSYTGSLDAEMMTTGGVCRATE